MKKGNKGRKSKAKAQSILGIFGLILFLAVAACVNVDVASDVDSKRCLSAHGSVFSLLTTLPHRRRSRPLVIDRPSERSVIRIVIPYVLFRTRRLYIPHLFLRSTTSNIPITPSRPTCVRMASVFLSIALRPDLFVRCLSARQVYGG